MKSSWGNKATQQITQNTPRQKPIITHNKQFQSRFRQHGVQIWHCVPSERLVITHWLFSSVSVGKGILIDKFWLVRLACSDLAMCMTFRVGIILLLFLIQLFQAFHYKSVRLKVDLQLFYFYHPIA